MSRTYRRHFLSWIQNTRAQVAWKGIWQSFLKHSKMWIICNLSTCLKCSGVSHSSVLQIHWADSNVMLGVYLQTHCNGIKLWIALYSLHFVLQICTYLEMCFWLQYNICHKYTFFNIKWSYKQRFMCLQNKLNALSYYEGTFH